jgi:uncharacterized protein YehS (DUF1456 family)
MNIWLRFYRLTPLKRHKRTFLRRALHDHIAKLENSYGKNVKYSIRSDTLDVHKLLVQNQMISSAIELLNLALSVAPDAKNLRDAKKEMISHHIKGLICSGEYDTEDEEFAWNSLYLSSLLQEGTSKD